MTTTAPAAQDVCRLPVGFERPPGDHEQPPAPRYAQGTLALDLPEPSGTPLAPGPPQLTVPPGGRSRRAGSWPAGIPDAHDWAARFVQAIVEVIGGDRPLSQLVRWTSEAVYVDMSRRVKILGATTAASRGRASRPQVQAVHICQPQEEVAEVAAPIRHGVRSRAIAARLEVVQGRWLCTALQMA